jgi:predicted GNAT family acetyltransferase
MDVDGGTALALYQSAPGKVLIYHTEVPRQLRRPGWRVFQQPARA